MNIKSYINRQYRFTVLMIGVGLYVLTLETAVRLSIFFTWIVHLCTPWFTLYLHRNITGFAMITSMVMCCREWIYK